MPKKGYLEGISKGRLEEMNRRVSKAIRSNTKCYESKKTKKSTMKDEEGKLSTSRKDRNEILKIAEEFYQS